MDQKSSATYRAEKMYKNSREKFSYLIREVLSNSIHAVMIRKESSGSSGFIPGVDLDASLGEKEVQITVTDNGEGFTQNNRKYFSYLDVRNPQKSDLNLHPKGQGRLALIYFTDRTKFFSVYRANDELHELEFVYPQDEHSLFDIEASSGAKSDKDDTQTILTMVCDKQQSIGRAKTFFSRIDSVDALANWIINTFFPFFMQEETLKINLRFNGQEKSINKSYIQANITAIPFKARISSQENAEFEFKVWLANAERCQRPKANITCFARHLKASLSNGKLEYEIDIDDTYEWLLTSEFFDENVDDKGDRIEVSESDVAEIQAALNAAMDEHFSDKIRENRARSLENLEKAKKKYHSLSAFISDASFNASKRIIKDVDIVGDAIDMKGKIEKKYWTTETLPESEKAKLLNSSLQVYIEHRSRVLNTFKELVKKYDIVGDPKPEDEDTIHDLFLKRGKSLNGTDDVNHLHNLWILDDKFTIFSSALRAFSSQRGQKASDIYLWIDDPDRIKELLILELKSTTDAHNAGNKYESMVAQVKRYAASVYHHPEKEINWDVDTTQVLFSSVILARKGDIRKELISNNVGGTYNKIPYLQSSYYFNERFAIGDDPMSQHDIRIDMYSYEDIYYLAKSRNTVFFKLLNGEYELPART